MQVQVQVQVQVQAHLEYGEELLGDQLGVGPRQVDLVDDRQDGQVRREGEEEVGDGLGLHPLVGVHQQQDALAGAQAPRHLVAEVHVPRRADQVEEELLAVVAPQHRGRLGLHRDSRSRSTCSESSTCLLAAAVSMAPACSSTLSARVDLPWSTCATMQKFLILSGGKAARSMSLMEGGASLYRRYRALLGPGPGPRALLGPGPGPGHGQEQGPGPGPYRGSTGGDPAVLLSSQHRSGNVY